jgi:hypothetical protein
MHIFRGSSSYISEFKTLLNIIYEALISCHHHQKWGHFYNLMSSPQPLFVRSKSFVEDSSVGWRDLCVSHLSSSLENFGLRQASIKHLLLLEVKHPRRLGVTLELPSVW